MAFRTVAGALAVALTASPPARSADVDPPAPESSVDEPATSEPTTEPAPSPGTPAAGESPSTPEARPGPRRTEEADVDRGAPPRCREAPRCVRLTAIGTSFGVLGLGAAVTGAVLLARPDQPLDDDPTKVRSTRPVGTVLVALGAGVLVSSVVMLVAAHRGRNDRATSSKTRSARARPTAIPGGVAF